MRLLSLSWIRIIALQLCNKLIEGDFLFTFTTTDCFWLLSYPASSRMRFVSLALSAKFPTRRKRFGMTMAMDMVALDSALSWVVACHGVGTKNFWWEKFQRIPRCGCNSDRFRSHFLSAASSYILVQCDSPSWGKFAATDLTTEQRATNHFDCTVLMPMPMPMPARSGR